MDLATAIGLAISGIAALSAMGAVLASLHNGRKIQDVHLTMNSRLDELLRATKAQAFAEGQEHQRAGDLKRVADGVLAEAAAMALVLDQGKARG